MAPLYICLFLVIIVLAAINMFIAIVNDFYNAYQEDKKAEHKDKIKTAHSHRHVSYSLAKLVGEWREIISPYWYVRVITDDKQTPGHHAAEQHPEASTADPVNFRRSLLSQISENEGVVGRGTAGGQSCHSGRRLGQSMIPVMTPRTPPSSRSLSMSLLVNELGDSASDTDSNDSGDSSSDDSSNDDQSPKNAELPSGPTASETIFVKPGINIMLHVSRIFRDKEGGAAVKDDPVVGTKNGAGDRASRFLKSGQTQLDLNASARRINVGSIGEGSTWNAKARQCFADMAEHDTIVLNLQGRKQRKRNIQDSGVSARLLFDKLEHGECIELQEKKQFLGDVVVLQFHASTLLQAEVKDIVTGQNVDRFDQYAAFKVVKVVSVRGTSADASDGGCELDTSCALFMPYLLYITLWRRLFRDFMRCKLCSKREQSICNPCSRHRYNKRKRKVIEFCKCGQRMAQDLFHEEIETFLQSKMRFVARQAVIEISKGGQSGEYKAMKSCYKDNNIDAHQIYTEFRFHRQRHGKIRFCRQHCCGVMSIHHHELSLKVLEEEEQRALEYMEDFYGAALRHNHRIIA
jgi:hypothetical protein